MALITSVLAVTLLGCGGDHGGKPTLVLYSGEHTQLTDDLVSAFQASTGISVATRHNDGIVLAQQLLHEGSSSPADVYIAENSPELTFLDQQGLLAELAPATLASVPAGERPAGGHWVGMAARVSGLAFNTGKIRAAELPASILDLADPRWAGKLALAPSDSDFVPIVGAVIAQYGEAAASTWLAGLKHNATTYQDIEAVVSAVDRGDTAVGLINQYYWYRLQLEKGLGKLDSSLYYFPNRNVGSVKNIAGAAVVAASAHRTEAEQFVAFLVSAQGQQILARGDDFEYPLRPGVAPNPVLPPLASVNPATLSIVALGNDQRAAQLLQRAGLL